MGDIADQIIEGEICQICCCPEGIDVEARGYPFTCGECGGEDGKEKLPNQMRTINPQHHATKGTAKKVHCPECNKLVAEVGLQQHMEAKHG